MAAQHQINLLPKDEFESSTVGKLVKWAVGVGRWVVVLTEFIVICAFLSRFYFDTQLANYFDEVKQKKAMVDSALTFEDKFRQIQNKTKIVKEILARESKSSIILNEVNSLLPLDTFLTEVGINDTKLTLGGYALSENGLNIFLQGLISSPQLTTVNLNNVSLKKETSTIVNFNISATVKPKK